MFSKIRNYLILKRHGVKLGVYKPSPKDNRDYSFIAGVPVDNLPDLDRNEYLIPNSQHTLYNQGRTNMCVAFASGRIMEQCEIMEHKAYMRMSFGFIYRNRTNADMMKLFDTDGMILKEALRHLTSDGVVPESLYSWYGSWKTLTDTVKNNPLSKDLFEQAKTYKLKSYFKLDYDYQIQSALLENKLGVLVSIPITRPFLDSLHTGGINAKLDYEWATTAPNLLGYHAVVIEGWTTINNKKYWVMANSWSENYGDKGYYYLEFGYPFREAWCLINNENRKPYWRVQIGAFVNKTGAELTQRELSDLGYDTYLTSINGLHKVQLGAFSVKENAENLQEKLKNDKRVDEVKDDLQLGESWIVRY